MSTKTIAVHLPDGSIREVPSGTTPLDIANSISPRLAAAQCRRAPHARSPRPQPSSPARKAGSSRRPSGKPRCTPPKTPPRRAWSISPRRSPPTSQLELLKEKRPRRAQSRAPLRRARHGHRRPRALPRNQARPRPRHRRRLLLRLLPREALHPEDLAAIEARMAEVVARDEKFVRESRAPRTGPRRIRQTTATS